MRMTTAVPILFQFIISCNIASEKHYLISAYIACRAQMWAIPMHGVHGLCVRVLVTTVWPSKTAEPCSAVMQDITTTTTATGENWALFARVPARNVEVTDRHRAKCQYSGRILCHKCHIWHRPDMSEPTSCTNYTQSNTLSTTSANMIRCPTNEKRIFALWHFNSISFSITVNS